MKRAIVFAGGGSKGAYEIGAWTALRELGQEFQIATGTSIGAINAVLYVQNDYECAKKLWDEITIEKIMTNGINMERSLTALVDQMDSIRPFLKTYINRRGADVTPFIENMEMYTCEEKFFNSDIDFGLITVAFPSLIPIEITKENIQRGYLTKWILASCSCFPVFPTCDIDAKTYIDGGYYDNLPIATAFRLGAEEVVAIDLNRERAHDSYASHPLVTYIRPSRELGSFMSFDRATLDSSIELGYLDTMKAFGKYFGISYTFIPDKNKMDMYEDLANRLMYRITDFETRDLKERPRLFSRNSRNAVCTKLILDRVDKKQLEPMDYLIAGAEITAYLLGYDTLKAFTFEEWFDMFIKDTQSVSESFNESLPDAISSFSKLRRKKAKEERTEFKFKEMKMFENDYEEIIAVALLTELHTSTP